MYSAAVVSPGNTGNAPDPDPTCAVSPTRVCPPVPRTTELVVAAATRADNTSRAQKRDSQVIKQSVLGDSARVRAGERVCAHVWVFVGVSLYM